MLEPVGRLEDLRLHSVVLGAMRGQTGKAGTLHQLLFAAEVRARELDQLVHQLAYLFAAATAHHRQTKFVQRALVQTCAKGVTRPAEWQRLRGESCIPECRDSLVFETETSQGIQFLSSHLLRRHVAGCACGCPSTALGQFN